MVFVTFWRFLNVFKRSLWVFNGFCGFLKVINARDATPNHAVTIQAYRAATTRIPPPAPQGINAHGATPNHAITIQAYRAVTLQEYRRQPLKVLTPIALPPTMP